MLFSCFLVFMSWFFFKLAELHTRKHTQRLLLVFKRFCKLASGKQKHTRTQLHNLYIYILPRVFCSGNFNLLQWIKMLCLNRTLKHIPMRLRHYGCDALWGLMAIIEYFMPKRIKSWSQRARKLCLPLHTKVQVWLTLTCKLPQDI